MTFPKFAAVALAVLATLVLATPASAALKPGAKAADFTTPAALAGKAFNFTLSQALKKGPVVLYFYPKAFTSGCTVEAHEFAEATPEFNKMGATVIGVSADDITTLKKFSIEACRNKFAVAVATPAIIKAFDAQMPLANMSNRTSYVIAPNGQIIYGYSALDYRGHMAGTLKAVRDYKAKRK